ncbi:peptide ABC transporter [Corynebacterium sp. 320]|uniref:ABC transporter substrate-binding protein n=1 Tax=unclassified Corynebacterium TaxID=2624378 RepID=UPI00125CC787|nr:MULTISPECIES: ABC transporter substrate-binding protein [unclassified Corynebacterium]KAB1503722.1 peptide ABC transporter [Corynebacterium sp. 320]KAB1553178.1 peptide ABC transporter [Corynebacterium sp. 321]KAB3527858.1 peptide ABC transporter [Corynebacterium sp. 250]KAB1553604.1 peptide ABC transporter [Corynebacterium sp. 319]KAB3540653.1 peptide ABC transporter [Corynebacterium sp. 366]
MTTVKRFTAHAARVATAVVGGVVIASAGLVACSSGDGDSARLESLGYVVPNPIMTTNAGTSLGVATDAAKVSARLYPGASIAGPEGQLLPNPDIVTATRAGDDPRRVDYVINDKAQYSDGHPVVCDDFVLTQAASSDPALFGSDLPLFYQVESIDCAPGNKQFAVHFKEGFGNRYMELFSAGTVMPAHIVAEKAEVADVVSAVASEDQETKTRIAQAWQDTFNVTRTDPASVPTSGPYSVAERGEDGHLKLVANPHYAGPAPVQDPLYVYPSTVDVTKLAEDRALGVADLDTDVRPQDVGLDGDDWVVQTPISERVDTLRLSGINQLESEEARRAFGECVDRARIAADVKKATGMDVQPTGLRVVPPTHALAPQLQPTNDAAMAVNLDSAREHLGGQQIRIGYLDSTPRYKTIVESIQASCADAGIEVQPIALSADSYGTLGQDYDVLLDTRGSFGRNSSENTNVFSRLEAIRASEENLQRDSMTIPLTTEPRQIAVEHHVDYVTDNGSDAGLAWNMDRWTEQDHPVESTEDHHE